MIRTLEVECHELSVAKEALHASTVSMRDEHDHGMQEVMHAQAQAHTEIEQLKAALDQRKEENKSLNANLSAERAKVKVEVKVEVIPLPYTSHTFTPPSTLPHLLPSSLPSALPSALPRPSHSTQPNSPPLCVIVGWYHVWRHGRVRFKQRGIMRGSILQRSCKQRKNAPRYSLIPNR